MVKNLNIHGHTMQNIIILCKNKKQIIFNLT